jgi:hypothetical protein
MELQPNPPTWITRIGLRLVEDVGNGMGLRLSWYVASPEGVGNQVHYNVYYSDTRFNVFTEGPKAITTATQVVINIPPGNQYYFAVRATEFDPDIFGIESMDQIGVNLYLYPQELELLEDIDAYGATVKVTDTSGYPDSGYLWLGDQEVVKYYLKSPTEFYIEDDDRGIYSTPTAHSAGADVKFWTGPEDSNTYIQLGTAAWHKDNSEGTPRDTSAIGEFNVADDGYRENRVDIITTNLEYSDENSEDFPPYDFTGYHRPSIQSTFSGECVRSYVGGEFDGARGFNFQDRSLARLDALLQVTGEPTILLRRKQRGKRCRCVGLQREHPQVRCQYCYGTGFEGGYDRYVNTRPISELWVNTQGFIAVRFEPYTDDLKLEGSQGLTQPSELSAWTINVPTVKDRDIIVRFTEDLTIEEFRYEVLDVNRNKLVFGQSGKQGIRMRRMDKTDVIYQYDITI